MNTLRLDFINDTPGSGESVTDTEYPDPLFYSLFTIFITNRAWKLGFWVFGYFVFFDIV